ncbi:MAG: hypothetical protein WCX27_02425 [Candidatus Paceibacterota bacterium]|jgi:hypothetical protein
MPVNTKLGESRARSRRTSSGFKVLSRKPTIFETAKEHLAPMASGRKKKRRRRKLVDPPFRKQNKWSKDLEW